MIFVESEIDKRGKLYKAVKDKGRIVELGRQDEATILRWIAGSVRRENKQYVYNVNKNTGVSNMNGNPWQIQIGVRYKF